VLQDLLHEVIDDVAVVPGEARNKAGNVVTTLHRQARELQRGDPAFRALLQRCHILCGQSQAHHLVEVRGGLVRREPQIGGAKFFKLAARSKAS
jgi:hypothetical protein